MRVETASFRDRTVRLQFFGVLTVLGGAIWILLGLTPWLPGLRDVGLPADPATQWMSLTTHLLLGAMLIGVGAGSIGRRRWVQPIMLLVAWTWLIGGILTVALVIPLLDNLLALATSAGQRSSATVARVFKVLTSATMVCGGILLPAIYIWAYREPDVRTTCEIAHPTPSWTESRPRAVLGLSVMLTAGGVLCLPLALKPVVPWFGLLLTGWPAAALLLLGAAGAVWLARATFRLSMAGWWATTLAMALIGLSIALTFAEVEPAAYYLALGLPDEQVALFDHPWVRPLLVGGTVALTLLSAVYMLAVRTYFLAPSTRGPDV